jgi:hypothetical protein
MRRPHLLRLNIFQRVDSLRANPYHFAQRQSH